MGSSPPTLLSAAASSRPSFDLPKIRDEILQAWLLSESKSGGGNTTRAQYCCFTYNDGVKAYMNKGARWYWLDRELSSNLAGETGAVYIYKGAQAAMAIRPISQTAREFCEEHMNNEQSHLQYFESILPDTKRTLLLPVWRAAGWMLGFLPTLVGGSRALYVTVEAVETFVEEHYQDQIVPLRKAGATKDLVCLLEHCCEEEVHHKEDAARKLLGINDQKFIAWWVKPWSLIVKTGSTIAAEVARRL